MFVYMYKLSEKLQMTLMNHIDFGMALYPKGGETKIGIENSGFIIKDSRGYIFVKNILRNE